jgi:hypothetical protein
MDDAGFLRFERPRKRGRPLTYEATWLVQHGCEPFANKKKAGGIIRIEAEDPSRVTSKYPGVARRGVATISQSVRQTGRVPVSPSPGPRPPPPAMPFSTDGQSRACIFAQHRQGTLGHAKPVQALRKATCGLDVQASPRQRHWRRLGCGWARTKKRPRSRREQADVRQPRHNDLSEIRTNRPRPVKERYDGVSGDARGLPPPHRGP